MIEKLRKDLAAQHPLEVIVNNGHFVRDAIFKSKRAENSSEETVKGSESDNRKFFHQLTKMPHAPLRSEPWHAGLTRQGARLGV